MTTEPKKRRDPPLRLDMDFAEALGRFVQTDPAELPEKAQAPPKAKRARRPAPASAPTKKAKRKG